MISKIKEIIVSDLIESKQSSNVLNFSRSVAEIFSYMRQITKKKQSYIMIQWMIVLGLLEKKLNKYKEKSQSPEKLNQKLQQIRKNVLINFNKQQKNNYTQKQVQNWEANVIGYLYDDNFLDTNRTINIKVILYLCQLIRVICSKKAQTNIFSDKVPNTYTNEDMKKIGKFFEQTLVLIDYDQSKKMKKKESYDQNTIYLLKMKQQYFILYYVKRKKIQLIDQSEISRDQLKKIFKIQVPQSSTNSNNSSIKVGQKVLFPIEIKCHVCDQIFSQFDCLKWNYVNYCQACLISLKVDTSHIPSSLISKFRANRGTNAKKYSITCANCTFQTTISNYNPANKPFSYNCQNCRKQICTEHQCQTSSCFCKCYKCNNYTIEIEKLKIKFCLHCLMKYCSKCNSKSFAFCKCICTKCLQRISNSKEDHKCYERCHVCKNNFSDLKDCLCCSKICSGCYYTKMNSNKDNEPVCIPNQNQNYDYNYYNYRHTQ